MNSETWFDTPSGGFYIPIMVRGLLAIALVSAVVAGCTQPGGGRRNDEMFGPSKIRLHPTFTEFKDFSGDGSLDGIEAVVELQDQFGEPTKGTGQLMLELFEYRQDFPAPRGRRVAGPWILPMVTREEQEAAWNRAVRGYSFQLDLPIPQEREKFVLSATFEPTGEGEAVKGRLFSELVIEKKRGKGRKE